MPRRPDPRPDEDAASDDHLAAWYARLADAGERADEDALDEAFPLGDGVADTEAEVWCPYCGEPNAIAVDPGGGPAQVYVEDCQVCCQPWRVSVHFGADGEAHVGVEPADGR